jgi:hypothetical protein
MGKILTNTPTYHYSLPKGATQEAHNHQDGLQCRALSKGTRDTDLPVEGEHASSDGHVHRHLG